MAKEVLQYGSFYSWNTADFVRELEAAKNEDLTVRINSDGGDVMEGWTCLAKFIEHKKAKKVKIDGKAFSMAAFFACYVEDAECLDVTEFLFHRAAYYSGFENSDRITQADWDSLNATNALLRKAFEAKVDVKKFEKLTGVTVDQLFTTPGRVDVILNAQQALAIGLVNKINTITPEAANQINAWVDKYEAKAANATAPLRVKVASPAPIIEPTKPNKMTLQELQAQHPALYAEIFNNGKTAGVTEERDRVEGLMVFAEIDAKLVKEKIASGKTLSTKETNEMLLKQASPEVLEKLKKEAAAGATDTPEVPAGEKSKEAKELEEFEAKANKSLGLKS